MIIFGIKNCDTVKKAKKWLETNNFTFEFHDFREQGLSEDELKKWINILGWEAILNKRSTSFRQLTSEQKESLNQDNAINLMIENPTLIKRPVLVKGEEVLIGFKAEQYETWLTL